MNASLKLTREASSASTRLLVPTFDIFEQTGEHFVWTVDAQTMQASKTPVTIENGIGEQLIVTDGLSAGDVIVGAGANYVTEGMKVRPWTKA